MLDSVYNRFFTEIMIILFDFAHIVHLLYFVINIMIDMLFTTLDIKFG